MSDGKLPSLPNGFGRAAEKLADTIRHVVDITVGPDRIRAKAQAQADAEVILAEGRVQIQDIESRAVDRLRKRETRRQHNIENITLKAFDALPSQKKVSDKPVNEDWTSRFFEECQDIGDEEMQQIWARILASEVAQPGSFSPRTLSVVRNFTREDADLFTKLCEFVWTLPGLEKPGLDLAPVIHNVDALHVNNAGIDLGVLVHLTSIGLIEFNNLVPYHIKAPKAEIAPTYFGKTHELKSNKEQAFEIGKAVFTAVGVELVRISGGKENEKCRKATLKYWSNEGWKEI